MSCNADVEQPRYGPVMSTLIVAMTIWCAAYFNACASPPQRDPTPALGEAPIILVMAGAERGGREPFVELIEPTGILAYTDFGLQTNATKDRFPEDFADGEARTDAYNRVTRKIAATWAPEPFVHAYYNNEPIKVRADGIKEHWMLRVMREPLPSTDAAYIRDSIKGMRDAISEAPGGVFAPSVDLGFYYMPRHPRSGVWKPAYIAAAESFGQLAGAQDLSQINCYWPYGDDQPLTDEIRDETRERLRTTVSYARTAAARVAFMFWPKPGAPNAEWIGLHLDIARELGVDRVIVWIKPEDQWHAERYANQLAPLAPMLLDFAKETP